MQKITRQAEIMVRPERMRGGTVAVSGRRIWTVTKAARRTAARMRRAIITALFHYYR